MKECDIDNELCNIHKTPINGKLTIRERLITQKRSSFKNARESLEKLILSLGYVIPQNNNNGNQNRESNNNRGSNNRNQNRVSNNNRGSNNRNQNRVTNNNSIK